MCVVVEGMFWERVLGWGLGLVDTETLSRQFVGGLIGRSLTPICLSRRVTNEKLNCIILGLPSFMSEIFPKIKSFPSAY